MAELDLNTGILVLFHVFPWSYVRTNFSSSLGLGRSVLGKEPLFGSLKAQEKSMLGPVQPGKGSPLQFSGSLVCRRQSPHPYLISKIEWVFLNQATCLPHVLSQMKQYLSLEPQLCSMQRGLTNKFSLENFWGRLEIESSSFQDTSTTESICKIPGNQINLPTLQIKGVF